MRQTTIFRTILIVIFCLCIGCVGGILISYFLNDGFRDPMAQGSEIEIAQGSDIAEVARAYQDCVVSIQVMNSATNTTSSLGSGVCVYAGGYIVTNYHVIAGAISNSFTDICVFVNGDIKKGYKSELLWANSQLDLAIIKSSYTNIKYGKMKNRSFECLDEDKLLIGEEVISIGTPIEMSLQNTTTFGRVNGLNRIGAAEGRVYEYLIQHQATINSGNSGGPLIDKNGNIVGINSCALVEDVNKDDVSEINFAIPIYPVIKVIDKIVDSYEAKKTYVEPILAISIQDSVYGQYKLGDYKGDGVKITANPYQHIGSTEMLKGDVIVGIKYRNRTYEINNVYDYYYNCLRAGNGESVTFIVERSGINLGEKATVVLP